MTNAQTRGRASAAVGTSEMSFDTAWQFTSVECHHATHACTLPTTWFIASNLSSIILQTTAIWKHIFREEQKLQNSRGSSEEEHGVERGGAYPSPDSLPNGAVQILAQVSKHPMEMGKIL
jgi:hypothetical protein